MFNRGKLDVISFNYRISTTKKRELCTACRALLGFINSLTKYEHNIISSDLSINVLNDHKPIFSCSADKGNLSPKNKTCTNAIKQIQKTSHYLLSTRKEKNFSVADMFSRSFFLEQLQLIELKQKQLPPQVLFATLTHDDQIKFKTVNCLVKHETVLPSLKDDCHSGLAHFGNDQILIGIDNEGEYKVIKTQDSFSFYAVQSIQVRSVKKPITEKTTPLFQQIFFRY